MNRDVFSEFKEPRFAESIARSIRKIPIKRKISIMHVCGTHEHTIARSGIRSLIPHEIRLVAGPGCPVCVCSSAEIDLAIDLAVNHDVILTTFGDMFRVPATEGSMEYFRALGADIRVVYSPADAVKVAFDNLDREVVFMAVGFETTAAPIAASIVRDVPKNFSIVPAMKLIPPALRFLIEKGSSGIDAFILPGHVSTIIGKNAYSFLEDEYGIPAAIAGFEAVDVLMAVKDIVEQISSGKKGKVSNLYRRAVRDEGNRKAMEVIFSLFEVTDAVWRGIGRIPKTGLRLRDRFEALDAARRFGVDLPERSVEVKPGCICDLVILGEAEPEECRLFGDMCTPTKPYGPCMVSSEGTCRARYKYRAV